MMGLETLESWFCFVTVCQVSTIMDNSLYTRQITIICLRFTIKVIPQFPLHYRFKSDVSSRVFYFGQSGVRALPLAAGINEGGHYFRYFSSFLLFFFSSFLLFFLPPLFKTTEGVVVGIQIFAWAPK